MPTLLNVILFCVVVLVCAVFQWALEQERKTNEQLVEKNKLMYMAFGEEERRAIRAEARIADLETVNLSLIDEAKEAT